MTDEYLGLQEAADLMGVSRFTLWRLIRDGQLTAYQSEADKRRKLVRRADVEALREPKPLAPAPKKPAA